MAVLEQDTTDEKTKLVSLVRAAQEGDADAFGELVERYERAVYMIAFRRLGNHAEAQELSQEVFFQALRKVGQLRQPECFGAWLRSIAKRMAINRAVRRQATFVSAQPEVLEATCVERETPLHQALSREQASQVHLGLDRLGSLDRQTLVAFYVEGRSLIEMSGDFDSPVGTIKRRLHVARKRLAKELVEFAAI